MSFLWSIFKQMIGVQGHANNVITTSELVWVSLTVRAEKFGNIPRVCLSKKKVSYIGVANQVLMC